MIKIDVLKKLRKKLSEAFKVGEIYNTIYIKDGIMKVLDIDRSIEVKEKTDYEDGVYKIIGSDLIKTKISEKDMIKEPDITNEVPEASINIDYKTNKKTIKTIAKINKRGGKDRELFKNSLIRYKEGNAYIVATESRVLVELKIGEATEFKDFLIRTDKIVDVLDITKDNTFTIEVYEKFYKIETETIILYLRRREDYTFPNYEMVMINEDRQCVNYKKIKNLVKIANEINKECEIKFHYSQEGKFFIKGVEEEFKKEFKLGTKSVGDKVIRFDPTLLSLALGAGFSDYITIETKNETNPMLIRDKKHRVLVMARR